MFLCTLVGLGEFAPITYKPSLPCDWVDINSTAIPNDTETLNIVSCKDLKPQEGALAHLYQLKTIIITGTNIAEFPNVTEVGDTLKTIYFYNNNISYINPDYFIGLDNVQTLNLGTNPYLDYIPDVPQLQAVKTLSLRGNAFTKIPQLSNAINLQELKMNVMEKLTKVDREDLKFFLQLTTLNINHNVLTEIPDYGLLNNTLQTVRLRDGLMTSSSPFHTLSMRNIKHLDVSLTPALSVLSTLCHEDLTSLSIDVSGSHVQLCDCRNVWLKQAAEAGAIITADTDTECDWHNATVMELLNNCLQVDAGKTTNIFCKI